MSNNVIQSAARFKKSSEEEKIKALVDEMTDVYERCTPAVEASIQLLIGNLVKEGYASSDFTYEDYVLMRESMFSMIMRSRDIFHPLQVVSHSFNNLVYNNDDC